MGLEGEMRQGREEGGMSKGVGLAVLSRGPGWPRQECHFGAEAFPGAMWRRSHESTAHD